jgi:uncharacterized protein
MRDQDFFWEGVQARKLLFQKCSDCGALRNPPGPMCPHCQSLHWEPRESQGLGTVAGWVLSKHPSRPDDQPRLVVLVSLNEGIRMISNLSDVAVDQVTEGMPVELFFAEVNGAVLPQFRPLRATTATAGGY